MVTLTPTGIQLAILEGQHAEEARTVARLLPLIRQKSHELGALTERLAEAERRQQAIEAAMSAILDQRRAA